MPTHDDLNSRIRGRRTPVDIFSFGAFMAEQSEPFVQWQSITREQFTVATSLILGLAVGALGYQATILLDGSTTEVTRLQFGSALCFAISVTFGIFVVINRLRDFRWTTRMVKLHENGEGRDEVNSLKVWTNTAGVWSWRLFWAQVWTFFAGITLFAIHFLGAIASKLQ